MTLETCEVTSTLQAALDVYQKRQARTAHPAGKTDKAGRWYPSDDEYLECCNSIREPSRAYPWGYMTHCRSLPHVAALTGVDPVALKKLARLANPPSPAYSTAYKAVAQVDGRLLSIYDGETEYVLGETLSNPARPRHNGGLYCYRSVAEAYAADVPSDSTLYATPRVIIEVQIAGRRCAYDNGKRAVSALTPLRIVGPVDYSYVPK